MKIKHSKYRNSGLIYELLVKQIASDTIAGKPSSAISILKKYYSSKSSISKEFKLYEFIVKNKGISEHKAEAVLNTITEIARKLDYKNLKIEKYNLISDIKDKYDLNEFFSIKVRDYKPLAALYCLLEAQNNNELVDPQVFVDNKITILEHLTSKKQNEEDVRESLIEDYSKYDKDLRLLTYKILLEKFNQKYDNFLPEQKEILKEFIVSVSSTAKLRNFVNQKLEDVARRLNEKVPTIQDEVVKIKLSEIVRNIFPLSNKEVVDDQVLSLLMGYYELLKEIENL